MDRSSLPPIRSLPRVFLPDLETASEFFDLPKEEVDKFRKVLRLEEGSHIAILPNDGTLIRCEFRAKKAWPLEIVTPKTESKIRLTLAQALPKGDRLETVLRMGTELGIVRFVLFAAERSVVRWDAAKLNDRRRRFEAIVREAAEQSYRSRLPAIEFLGGLAEVLETWPTAMVLSELESVSKMLPTHIEEATLVVGPEGGWAPREIALIGQRGITLGPLVLRTDTAGIAAAAAILCPR